MNLREFLDEADLKPEVEGLTGLLDRKRRDQLMARMPINKVETRLQNALSESLYPLVDLGNIAIAFTYPSRVFLIATTMRPEIEFEAEKALEHAAADIRDDLRIDLASRLQTIKSGNGADLVF
jgi:hypothetical protein